MEGGRDADETLTAAFEGYIRELEGEPVETVPYDCLLYTSRCV